MEPGAEAAAEKAKAESLVKKEEKGANGAVAEEAAEAAEGARLRTRRGAQAAAEPAAAGGGKAAGKAARAKAAATGKARKGEEADDEEEDDDERDGEGEDEGEEAAGEEGPGAEVVAEAEGLELHLAPSSASGYRGVEKRPNGRYKARVYERGTAKNLGDFETAVEAAVGQLVGSAACPV